MGLHRIRRCHNPPPEPPDPVKNCRLKVGDRIVWMSDTGPEYGHVKWIGHLPDSRSFEDVTVGVEFVSSVTSDMIKPIHKVHLITFHTYM